MSGGLPLGLLGQRQRGSPLVLAGGDSFGCAFCGTPGSAAGGEGPGAGGFDGRLAAEAALVQQHASAALFGCGFEGLGLVLLSPLHSRRT